VSGELGDGSGKMCRGDSTGEAMGLSEDCVDGEREGVSGDCMLKFAVTVRSLVTRRVFRGTTGVPRDCWLRRVASLVTGGLGERVGGAVLLLVAFWFEPVSGQSATIVV
jgi:hypothetical protein